MFCFSPHYLYIIRQIKKRFFVCEHRRLATKNVRTYSPFHLYQTRDFLISFIVIEKITSQGDAAHIDRLLLTRETYWTTHVSSFYTYLSIYLSIYNLQGISLARRGGLDPACFSPPLTEPPLRFRTGN